MATKAKTGSSLPGYWLVGSDGTVTAHGDAAQLGAKGSLTNPTSPVVAAVASADGGGYWVVEADGTVTAFGDAVFAGDPHTAGFAVSDIVGMAPTIDGKGYWLVGADGGVFGFGDATFKGAVTGLVAAHKLAGNPGRMVGIAATATGGGYWVVGAHGGVYAFGDATFYGSEGGKPLAGNPGRMVGIAATATGGGYWVVGADGGVYAFGDATFYGSEGGKPLAGSIVGVAATTDGKGYWLVGADGGVFNFGDATFAGSGVPTASTAAASTGLASTAAASAGLASTVAASTSPVVGLSPTFDGGGYWLARADGTVVALGDAPAVDTGSTASIAPTGSAAPALAPIVAIAASDRLVPSNYVNWTQQAAATCSGLSWTVLAAIAKVESNFGTSTLPGVHSASNAAGAEGPMQFLPATFAAYDHPITADTAATPAAGVTPASPYDPVDAIWAAARLLCASGGAKAQTVSQAIFSYNHASWYVNEVEALAASYQLQTGTASGVAQAALAAARTQFGVPYVWGGESPGQGFDCSGLVQWAYRSAGVILPRTSQAQWAALHHLPASTALQPGDLVFFAGSDGTMTAPGHVGIYIGNGQMINAPYTGTVVRIDTIDWTDYVGAARPAATAATAAAATATP